nr:MAG TPA: hypothetical protein [Caudoviricetes sp.]
MNVLILYKKYLHFSIVYLKKLKKNGGILL